MSAEMTTPAEANRARHSRSGLGYIFIAVVSYAFIPTVIGHIGGEALPFYFMGAWRAGVAVGCAAILIPLYVPLWFNRYNWGRFRYHLSTSETKAVDWRFPMIRVHLRVDELRIPLLKWKIPGDFIDWRILLTILGNCEYALFAWSLKYIDIAVTTLLFQSWPIFFLLLSAMLLRKDANLDTSGKGTLSLILLIGLGFIGFAFIIFSQTGEIGKFGELGLSQLVMGLALALGAMVLSNLKAFGIDWARNLGSQLSGSLRGLGSDPAIFFVIVSFLLSSLGAAVVGLIVGFSRGETFDFELLSLAFLAGLVVNTTAGLMWRKANMADDDISFNALGYAIPILALVGLFIFNQADISRIDYLILGATAIIVANMLINFEAEVRWSFEALILALGGCGMVVYFLADIFDWLGHCQLDVVRRRLLWFSCPGCHSLHAATGVQGGQAGHSHQRRGEPHIQNHAKAGLADETRSHQQRGPQLHSGH